MVDTVKTFAQISQCSVCKVPIYKCWLETPSMNLYGFIDRFIVYRPELTGSSFIDLNWQVLNRLFSSKMCSVYQQLTIQIIWIWQRWGVTEIWYWFSSLFLPYLMKWENFYFLNLLGKTLLQRCNIMFSRN